MSYANLERLDIALGDATAGNRFTIVSTHGAPDNLAITNLSSGSGADTLWSRRSPARPSSAAAPATT